MASVKIDLGFGEQAILSERAAAGVATAKHQQDAEKFLRRWPLARSIEQESSYLRRLGLHVGQPSPGVNPSDTSAQLRAAVKSGKVLVVIERVAPTGGGINASGPTCPPYPLEMRKKAARTAPARKSYSYDWPRNYNDVSADDLINYIQSVVGGTATEAAATDAAPSMALTDAQPFEYREDSPLENVQEVAARGVSEADEAECHAQYEMEMEMCSVRAAMYGGDFRTYKQCTDNAFGNYQACRGYSW
ncbi:hypothetical protein [Trinickia sp.]|uniref:hypothetical protein n=1 Tax=Trinickia sp. TaxID=2571163 RepID=UPI003F803C99